MPRRCAVRSAGRPSKSTSTTTSRCAAGSAARASATTRRFTTALAMSGRAVSGTASSGTRITPGTRRRQAWRMVTNSQLVTVSAACSAPTRRTRAVSASCTASSASSRLGQLRAANRCAVGNTARSRPSSAAGSPRCARANHTSRPYSFEDTEPARRTLPSTTASSPNVGARREVRARSTPKGFAAILTSRAATARAGGSAASHRLNSRTRVLSMAPLAGVRSRMICRLAPAAPRPPPRQRFPARPRRRATRHPAACWRRVRISPERGSRCARASVATAGRPEIGRFRDHRHRRQPAQVSPSRKLVPEPRVATRVPGRYPGRSAP